jgi:hypothetical protein
MRKKIKIIAMVIKHKNKNKNKRQKNDAICVFDVVGWPTSFDPEGRNVCV